MNYSRPPITNGLILAAGNSSRLGQPKQLIKFKNKTLLATIESQLLACCEQVFVVLGHEPELLGAELTTSQIITNPNWESGMGSSLALGATVVNRSMSNREAMTDKRTFGLLVALCDQPLIEQQHYQNLVETFKQKSNHIIATEYQNLIGVPAIFPNHFIKDLTQLDGHFGAKRLIDSCSEKVKTIRCDAASYDLDTTEDLTELLSRYQCNVLN